MNAICLVIDRLHVGYLGCYGNSWIATPHFDRLAADGFLFDQALVESPELGEFYASASTGGHALDRLAGPLGRQSIVERLAAAGRRTMLVTDEPQVAELPWAENIDEVIRIEEPARGAEPADTIADTHLAKFFAVLSESLPTDDEPFCLWAHTAALGAAWDAPRVLCERYQDEGDPPIDIGQRVPCKMLAEDYDPDEMLAVCHAYAGQIGVLDTCLGALLAEIEQLAAARDALLVVMSARGFPLGEHRRLGPVDDALFAELVHIPWLLRFPDGRGASERSQALVQPCDLAPTLLDCLGVPVVGETTGKSLLGLVNGAGQEPRDRAYVVSRAAGQGVRTPAWYMIASQPVDGGASHAGEQRVELYAKPDDRWDVNDVADRCPEVVELLSQVLGAARGTSVGAPPAPLAEVLLSGLE